MDEGLETSPDLVVTLEIPETAIVGLSVLATLRVTNRGQTPVIISARLNLMEGDLHLIVGDPDGSSRVIRSWQADTGLRRVSLPPTEQLIGTLNLLQTANGATFPAPGRYTVRAEYFPSPAFPSECSAAAAVTVRLPETDVERHAARLLESETVRRALVLAQSDLDPQELHALATDCAGTLDGKLAQLILAGAGEGIDNNVALGAPSVDNLISTASLISALNTPYSQVGKRLAKSFSAQLEGQSGLETTMDTALGMVQREAIKTKR